MLSLPVESFNQVSNMEIEPITSKTGVSLQGFPLVEYQTCETCGFRLVRVELSTAQTHPSAVSTCPICGSTHDENGYSPGKQLTRKELLAAFDSWLQTHGLTRNQLKSIYRLPMESFFASAPIK